MKSEYVQAIVRGLLLRCPRCGTGGIMRTFFELNTFCPHCHTRFERQPGEGTGAMILLLSLLPLPMILVFIVIFQMGPGVNVVPLILVMAVGLLLLILAAYRHARGAWLGVIAATSGLFTDEEYALRNEDSARR